MTETRGRRCAAVSVFALVLGDERLQREAAYSALTRGRQENHLYVAREPDEHTHDWYEHDDEHDTLRRALERSEQQTLRHRSTNTDLGFQPRGCAAERELHSALLSRTGRGRDLPLVARRGGPSADSGRARLRPASDDSNVEWAFLEHPPSVRFTMVRMSDGRGATRKPVILLPGDGRPYEMGGMHAVFKADGDITHSRYNVSEWWLDPHTHGPGAHSHDEDDIFYVIEGTMEFLVGDEWHEAPKGSFVLAPGGVTHAFKNSSDDRAGALNFGVPGGFEAIMPSLVEYFGEHPPGPA